MTREEYLNQRNQLMNQAKGFVDNGNTEEFNKIKSQVEALDAKYESEATAQANYAALNNSAVVSPELQNLGGGIGGDQINDNTQDIFDTEEYKTAFMNFACRNKPIPAKFMNVAATSTTADTGAVIPTTMIREIIRGLKERGIIFQQLRHMNIQGGVEIPILDLAPTAKWVTESAASEDQKVESKKSISFSYHMLECKIAQSILVNVVTIDEFQNLFVELATEAIIAAVEQGVFKGTGTGQMKGVCKDERVTKKVSLAPADFASYSGWKKNVFAKIPKKYQKGKFFMAQGTFEGYIDGMVDSTGQPVGRTNYGIDGNTKYSFGGKPVETVEDDVLTPYDTAEDNEVVAVFMDLKNYIFNSNMEMTVVHWIDHDTNKKKTKVMLVCDGKAADTEGIILITKGAAAAAALMTDGPDEGKKSSETEDTKHA